MPIFEITLTKKARLYPFYFSKPAAGKNDKYYYGVELEVPEEAKNGLQAELRGLAGSNRIRVM